MDLKAFYFKNIKETEYHFCFYDFIKDVNKGYDILNECTESNDYSFETYDTEEAITKFKELCQPEETFASNESKCWFYLITYYLNQMGYVIKEFPQVLSRPPADPSNFTYVEIRNRIIAQGGDDNGIVRYRTRRSFVAELSFERKPNHIGIDDSIDQKFIEISNRQASFNNMSTEEKLSEIANLIEYMLKKNERFITIDYSSICFNYISDEIVKDYRKKMQCFRHATSEAIAERNSYSEEQKNFFIDFGLTIIKVIHTLTE